MVDTKNEIWKEIRLNTNYLVSNSIWKIEL